MRFAIFYTDREFVDCVVLDDNGRIFVTKDYDIASDMANRRGAVVVNADEVARRWKDVVDGTWKPKEVRP